MLTNHTALGLEALRQIPIRDVAVRLGIPIRRSNSLRCPFPNHTDRNPSFWFFPGTNSCRCFGCGRGGSVIDLVAISQGWSIREAIRWLKSSYFAETRATKVSERLPIKQRTSNSNIDLPPEPPSFQPNSDIYEELLRSHPIERDAAIYLKDRGFSHSTRILDTSTTAMRVGYSINMRRPIRLTSRDCISLWQPG
jgi:DNA primase